MAKNKNTRVPNLKQLVQMDEIPIVQGEPEPIPGMPGATVEFRDLPDETPQDAVEAVTVKMEMRIIASVCLAALCRLQHLEGKKKGLQGRIAICTPKEEAEFHRLTQWWNAIGYDKQQRLKILAEDLAQDVNMLADCSEAF